MLKVWLVLLIALTGIARGQGAATTRKAAAPVSGSGSFLDNLVKRVEGLIESINPSSSAYAKYRDMASTPNAPPKSPPHKTAAAKPASLPQTPAPPPPIYEDSGAIRPGISYDDLIRRFGPPTVAITESPRIRTLLYSGKDGPVQIEVQGGKVTSVHSGKFQQPSVMLPG